MESWNCYNLCDFDYVQIYDVTTASEKTLCGFMAPYTHMTSAGSTIDVKFESDLSSGGRGFKLVYGIVDGNVYYICHEMLDIISDDRRWSHMGSEKNH